MWIRMCLWENWFKLKREDFKERQWSTNRKMLKTNKKIKYDPFDDQTRQNNQCNLFKARKKNVLKIMPPAWVKRKFCNILDNVIHNLAAPYAFT